MQLVHWNLAYENYTAALAHPDGLAILSFLFKADDDNKNYDPLKVSGPFCVCHSF